LRALRRLGVRALRGLLLLVAQDVWAVPRRAAREGQLLALLHRDQPDLLPTALPWPARDAAPRLDLQPPRLVGGLEPGLDDRRLRDGLRHARLPDQRCANGARRPASRSRPLGRRHARVVHELSAARVQLRQGSVRDERAASARLAASITGGGFGPCLMYDPAPG